MEGLCSVGRQENAVCCCVCTFPLLLFCEAHFIEHRCKPGLLHHTLPLEAQYSIRTREDFSQIQQRLNRLNSNSGALRERVVELSRNEEKIDAVYGELQEHAGEIRDRLKAEFTLAKAQFQAAVEFAIKETSDHALDTQSFVPADAFSQLIWSRDPGYIAACQIYTFKANTLKEYLDTAFQVSLQFLLPGFEHLKVGQSSQSPSERIDELMKAVELKDETHNHEAEGLRKALGDAQIYNAEGVKARQNFESAIQELQRQLQGTQEQLRGLHNDAAAKESRCSALQKENLNLAAQVKAKADELSQQALNSARTQKELETKNNELTIQVRDKDEQLTAANSKITVLEERCAAMGKRIKELEENVLPAVPRPPVPGAPLEKLIAVLNGEVMYIDVATSQWQQLCAFRNKINIDRSTSSTFIAPTTIFVCGGGNHPCTCHVGNGAYLLQADNGSVQELPHMSAGRRCPGVAWDSERKALYVFGGFDRGTCYTDYLRTSEMFLTNEWSPLPEMHQNRCDFNPCWHSCLVYLCGGVLTNSVETYDPRSNTFALQDFTLPETSGTTAVVECGVLTVLSEHYISKLQQGRLTSQKHEGYLPWSNCTPVVSGGAVYIVSLYINCCRSMDLTTGAARKKVSLS